MSVICVDFFVKISILRSPKEICLVMSVWQPCSPNEWIDFDKIWVYFRYFQMLVLYFISLNVGYVILRPKQKTYIFSKESRMIMIQLNQLISPQFKLGIKSYGSPVDNVVFLCYLVHHLHYLNEVEVMMFRNRTKYGCAFPPQK